MLAILGISTIPGFLFADFVDAAWVRSWALRTRSASAKWHGSSGRSPAWPTRFADCCSRCRWQRWPPGVPACWRGGEWQVVAGKAVHGVRSDTAGQRSTHRRVCDLCGCTGEDRSRGLVLIPYLAGGGLQSLMISRPETRERPSRSVVTDPVIPVIDDVAGPEPGAASSPPNAGAGGDWSVVNWSRRNGQRGRGRRARRGRPRAPRPAPP